jgi:hemerythrin superfamily protein
MRRREQGAPVAVQSQRQGRAPALLATAQTALDDPLTLQQETLRAAPFFFNNKDPPMSATLAYEDAIDLLDADHKLAQKLFRDYQGLSEDGAPSEDRRQLALKICQDLSVHTQIEEEIFYPRVGAAIQDDGLMEEALREHAQAKTMIARIQGMSPSDAGYDDTVTQLGQAIMDHVMDEREQMFLKARYSTVDLRGMVPELYARKKELQSGAPAPMPAGKKKVAS